MICWVPAYPVREDNAETVHKMKSEDDHRPACGTRTKFSELTWAEDGYTFITCERCLKKWDADGTAK